MALDVRGGGEGGSEQWWQIIMLTLSDMGRGSNLPGLLLNSHECQTANVKWLNLISLFATSSKHVCRCVCIYTCKFLFVFFKYLEYYHITEFRGWVIFEILDHYQHYLHYLHSEGMWFLKFWNITNITYILRVPNF